MLEALRSAADILDVAIPTGFPHIARQLAAADRQSGADLQAAAVSFRASPTVVQAVVLLASVAKSMPDTAPLSWMLCEALFRLGAPKALHEIVEYERRFGSHTESCVLRGRLLLSAGHAREALAAFDESIGLGDDRADAWFGKGKACLALGAAAEACAAFRQVTALRPADPEAAFHLGLALCEASDPRSAADVLVDVLNRAPSHAQAWFQLGLASQDLGRHRDAIDGFAEALRCNPEWAEAYFNRGVSFLGLGDIDAAMQDFAAALAHDPACKGPVAQALTSERVGKLWLDPDAMMRDLSVLHLGAARPEPTTIDAGLS
jgi:tetratricopeptide (TPR) repeat protein